MTNNSEKRQILTHKNRKTIHKGIVYLVLILLSAVFLIPFMWMLLTSVKSMQDVYSNQVFPTHIFWENYKNAVTQIPFLRMTINTVVITVLTVIGMVISSTLVAYSMAKIRWRGRGKVRRCHGRTP